MTMADFANAPGTSAKFTQTRNLQIRFICSTQASLNRSMAERHGDHHGLWIDPTNPNRIANVSDGGAAISTDGGKNWTTQNNQPTAQFYHVAVDNAFPYH